MHSFVFWLTVAAALGAIVVQVTPLGVPEILILFVVVNAIYYYGIRRRRTPSTARTA